VYPGAILTALKEVVPPLVLTPPILEVYPSTVTYHYSVSPAARLSKMDSMFFTIPSPAVSKLTQKVVKNVDEPL